MASSTINTRGSTNRLLEIVDHEGTLIRVVIANIASIEATNSNTNRIIINSAGNSTLLLFDNTVDMDAALVIIDGLF